MNSSPSMLASPRGRLAISPRQARAWLPPRPSGAHKGDFGHVLVLAGSRGMTGAAVLAARAALRAGAGLVTVALPQSQQPIAASQLPEAQTLPLPETSAGTLAVQASGVLHAAHKSRGYRVLAVGPGLSTQPDVPRAVVAVLGGLSLPAVVDADALNVLALQPKESVRRMLARRGAPCVLTPHPGEMARLMRVPTAQVQGGREAAAQALSRDLGVVCVLKGRGTVVADGGRAVVNSTGNAGLAKGGTGDALTGVIAALWSQRLGTDKQDRGFEAAALGAYLHGLAADIAVKRGSVYSLLATDVIEALPSALRRLAGR